MRPAIPLAFALLATVLAGCAGGGGGDEEGRDADSFDDLGVQPTATTGILLGVVVDAAIRPIAEAQVSVQKPDGGKLEAATDAEGRFAFGDLQPGAYLIQVSHLLYAPAQTTADVVAGAEDPAIVRVLLERLFEQDPYTEIRKFDGYLACSYSFPVGSTCVNDYTRLNCIASPPAPCLCPGGCLKEQNVSRQGGNIREYVSAVGPGWQSIVFETTWEPSVDGTSPELTISVSYFTRLSTGHFFASAEDPDPILLQVDVGEDAPGSQTQEGEPERIEPEGRDDLFTFWNNGGGPGSVTVNQQFTAFQTNFYYGKAPADWSFIAGDELPF